MANNSEEVWWEDPKPLRGFVAGGLVGTGTTTTTAGATIDDSGSQSTGNFSSREAQEGFLGDCLGRLGQPWTIKSSLVDITLEKYLEALKLECNVDDWLQVVRNTRAPDEEWHDRWKTRVQESEQLLYLSNSSLILKDKYTASKINELFFHIIRAYLRAEEGNFEAADIIWNELAKNWMNVDLYRQSNLLYHLFVTSLCTNQWDKALGYMKQLWSLVKSMDSILRHEHGAWDDWTTCLLVSWYFSSRCKTFLTYFRDYHNIQGAMLIQKKGFLINHLHSDFLIGAASRPYYEKACKLNYDFED